MVLTLRMETCELDRVRLWLLRLALVPTDDSCELDRVRRWLSYPLSPDRDDVERLRWWVCFLCCCCCCC